MYCYNCGKEISDSVKFCPHCGVEQEKANPRAKTNSGKKSIWQILRKILLILIVIPLVLFGLILLSVIFEDDDVETTAETNAATTEAVVIENGWQEVSGNRYYFEDGLKYVDLHEINGKLYYFDENGVLAVNTDITYKGAELEAGYDGEITAITYGAIYGKWAEESYHFGNGGSSSILELSTEAKRCDSFDFYLESHGERGAKVNGNWKVYVRCNGNWEFAGKLNYTEPSGTFHITFDSPMTFDAITAYPTVQGNASYSSLFYLKNVHCYL